MELHALGGNDNRQQSQRWRDPSATIFREQSLTRVSTPTSKRARGNHGHDASPAVSRGSGFTAGSSTVILHRPSHHSSAKMSCRSCCDCLGRIPFGSLLATLITGTGIGLTCVCFSIGLPHLIAMLRKFQLSIKDGVEEAFMTAVISIGAVMATLAVVLLIIGVLATGATRRQVYTGAWSRITGRIAAAFFILLTYFLTILWFFTCLLLVVVSSFFVVSVINCLEYQESGRWDGNCFNVSTIVEGIPAEIRTDQLSTRICGDDFKEFCAESQQGHLFFYAANGGVGLIVLGLIHFLMCLAANYAHIKDGLKLREYEEAKYTIDARDYASF